MDACIACLHELGYAATTTIAVQRRAGVSRGGLLHHFPTRVDLILATAVYIIEIQNALYAGQMEPIVDPLDRFLGITDFTWQAMKEPPGVALTEIYVGMRSDPELRQHFPPVVRAITEMQHGRMWALAQEAGMTDQAAVQALTDMMLAGMRGLAIQLLYSGDAPRAERAMAVLRYRKSSVMRALLRAAEDGGAR